MSRFGRLCVALVCFCLQLSAAGALLPGSAAAATPLSPESLGINVYGSAPDLATASAAGVGLARIQVIQGTNTDAVVELTAAAHLRLYPMLGIRRSQGAAVDAGTMAAFVTSFAQQYGRGGTFWAQHPELPYLPVVSYEIGNEPDITPTAPADETSLHYADPAGYAQVYEAARTALHQVDPAAQAVVGGMLDSGGDRARSSRAVPGRDRPDGCGGLPPLPLQRDDHGAGHAGAACLARRAWGCRRPARHQRVRSAGRHLRLGSSRSRSTPSGRCARRRCMSKTYSPTGGVRFRWPTATPGSRW